MLHCLIVDDSPRFLDADRALLERQGIEVVGVASTGAEALRKAAALRPDVALVDVDLGGENGFELTSRLRRQTNPVPVILISTHAEDDYVDLIEVSPALGFLPKSTLCARHPRPAPQPGRWRPRGPRAARRTAPDPKRVPAG